MLTMMSDESFYKRLQYGQYIPIKISVMLNNEDILSNLIGDAIGCGVTIAKLENFRPDFQMLDKFIRENISNKNLSTDV